jgi:hypothetical protein
MDDIAGETAEAQGEFPAEIQKGTNNGQECAKDEKSAAEFAERIHATKFMSGTRPSQRAASIDLRGGKESMD